MKNISIPVKRIEKAQIRYYEMDKNGCEIPEISAYTYFLNVNGNYINLFHPCEECNIYKRVPYANTTVSGESFGTKIELVTGKEEDGVCYILEKENHDFTDLDCISYKELEKRILSMGDFIVDRIFIEESMNFIDRYFMRDLIESDQEELIKLQDYINSKESVKKLIK